VAGQPGGPVGLAVPGLSRASNLLGAPVLDSLDELLGSVEDIVIDPEDGRIQYVAVAAAPNASRGAGGGERLLALPPDLLRSGPEHTVVVNVTKAELSKAAAFSPSAWPNAADREWIAGAWRPFGLSPYWTVPPSVTAVRPPEVRSPDAPQPPAWRGERVSALLNEPVRNPEGGDLGAVQDLVFNMLNQRVAFAIVTPADSIDLADRLLAVPWRATAQSRSQLVVAIDESEAHRAPGFSPDAWPNMNDVQWLNEVNGFFKDRPAAQPRTRRVQSG
jgi:sporulation protein YlmC with PRC-barrel domain